MAVDPFTQQVVQYYNCPINAEGDRAIVPFSNNYTAGVWGRPSSSPRSVMVTKSKDRTAHVRRQTSNMADMVEPCADIIPSEAPELDLKAESAIYTGLLDPPVNISSVLNFECRTGNCTLPSAEDGAAFLSLALESRCADIQSNIFISQCLRNFTFMAEPSMFECASLSDYGITWDETGNLLNRSVVMQSGYKDAQGWPSSFLSKVSFLMKDRQKRWAKDWRLSLRAFECEFYPVVNTYSANITNGMLREQVLNSQRMDVWPVHLDTHALLLVNRTIRRGEWHDCSSRSEPSDENNLPIIGWPSYKGLRIGTSLPWEQLLNRSGNDWNRTQWWPQDCVYAISYAPTAGLSSTLNKLLGNSSLYFDEVTERAKGYPWSDNPWSVNIWNGGNATLETVQAAMDGLARSVTARWRQGDGTSDNIGPARGIVWENQTCIRVNWAWISFPVGLLLSTIIFLFLTIWRTKSKGTQVWKGSILAVLFNGLDLGQDAGPAVSLEEMRVAAEGANVRLAETKKGLRLVGES